MGINGVRFDWESTEIQLPNGVAVDISEISYDDERGLEERYGKGAVPRGVGRKNYKAGGKMTLDKEEFERLRKELGGSVYSNTAFNITVSYANAGSPTVTDTLPDCMITKNDTSGKQGDDNVGASKLDFRILKPIKWNGVEAYK